MVDDGEIVERGTHESLLEKRGFYYNLYTGQFKGQVAVPERAKAPVMGG